ncbi:antimicrobial peptide microplusin-like [Haemaphysalis longicornis]
MNAVVASSLLVVSLVVVASAHHLELCKKSDAELVKELDCIKGILSEQTNAAFEAAVKQLNCTDRPCAIKKLCAGNDLEGAMAKYFTPEQINEIHNAATACDPDAEEHKH